MVDCIRHAPRTIIVLTLALLIVLPTAHTVQADTDASPDPLTPINLARDLREIAPVQLDSRLSALATTYAEAMLERRCTCLDVLGHVSDRPSTLTDDLRTALDLTTEDIHAGMTVAWDTTASGGIVAATGRESTSGVLLAPDITVAGIGTAVVPAEASWLTRPLDGSGPPIDLTGYTIVVILTVGVGSTP